MLARAHPGPRRKVCGGAETGHVGARLGDDDLRHTLAHARDRRQLFKLAGERAHLLLDARAEFLDRRGELVDAPQMQHAQKRVVLTEVAGQRLHQLRDLRAHPTLGHLRQLLRVAFASDERGQHRPPGDPEDVAGHRRQLDPGFELLLQPRRLPTTLGDQRGAVAGQIPQLPDRLRRHERGTQQPALTQLTPRRCRKHVGLATGQPLSVGGVDEHHVQVVLHQVERAAPVIASRFPHHQRHLLGDQPVPQLQQRVGGGWRRCGSPGAATVYLCGLGCARTPSGPSCRYRARRTACAIVPSNTSGHNSFGHCASVRRNHRT